MFIAALSVTIGCYDFIKVVGERRALTDLINWPGDVLSALTVSVPIDCWLRPLGPTSR